MLSTAKQAITFTLATMVGHFFTWAWLCKRLYGLTILLFLSFIFQLYSKTVTNWKRWPVDKLWLTGRWQSISFEKWRINSKTYLVHSWTHQMIDTYRNRSGFFPHLFTFVTLKLHWHTCFKGNIGETPERRASPSAYIYMYISSWTELKWTEVKWNNSVILPLHVHLHAQLDRG